jgi:hypothetical protein
VVLSTTSQSSLADKQSVLHQLHSFCTQPFDSVANERCSDACSHDCTVYAAPILLCVSCIIAAAVDAARL